MKSPDGTRVGPGLSAGALVSVLFSSAGGNADLGQDTEYLKCSYTIFHTLSIPGRHDQVSSLLTTVSLKVDFKNQTVNGKEARITPTGVSWTQWPAHRFQAGSTEAFTISISLLSGDYHYAFRTKFDSGGSSSTEASGTCRPQHELRQ